MSRRQIKPRKRSKTLDNKNFSIKCAYCKSQNTVKRGLRKTQKRGKQQRYLCKDCHKTFTQNLGFWKMKNPERLITMSIDLFFNNLSSRRVRNQLEYYEDNKVCHETILAWVRKYSKLIGKFVNKLKPKLSGFFYADETSIKVSGEDRYFWACIDGTTKYVMSNHFSSKQDIPNARKFFSKIKKYKPVRIQTDSLKAYPRAFKKVFYTRYKKDRIEHKMLNVWKDKKHNVKIERFFRELKTRIKLMFGFKACWSAELILQGFCIWYNYIRIHQTLGTTPAQKTGIKLNNTNRLKELIKISSVAF